MELPYYPDFFMDFSRIKNGFVQEARHPKLACDIPKPGCGYERNTASCLYIIVEFKPNSLNCHLVAGKINNSLADKAGPILGQVPALNQSQMDLTLGLFLCV